MFDKNSIIYAVFSVNENNLDLFLNTYFDYNGKCLIRGVNITINEIIRRAQDIKKLKDTLGVLSLPIYIPINIDVMTLDDDFIKNLIKNGSCKINKIMSGINQYIQLDLSKYGLKNPKITSLFTTGEEKQQKLLEFNNKCEKIICDILEYKKQHEINISDNESIIDLIGSTEEKRKL